MKYPTSKKRFGFTLIELLIAVSLFSIAVAISVGGFVHALRTQRQLIALISANSSASLAIEQMARAIRTGYSFKCDEGGGTGACDKLTFTSAAGDTVAYFVDYTTPEDGAFMIQVNDADAQSLLPANAQIRYLSFIFMDARSRPNYPPRITVNMGVTAKSYGLEGNVTNLQTTVSARNF